MGRNGKLNNAQNFLIDNNMNDINLYSNPKKALINAKKYLGKDTELYISNRKT